jgi:ATP-dependent Clp protease ATP-binding subunit ClpC
MFERYTEKARRAIFFARYEAGQHGSPYIEPEHLLLGMLREDNALFARLLPNEPGPQDLDDRVRRNLKPGPAMSTSVDLPLSDTAKRALAYAAEESERFSHRYIDTVHLLHALMRESSLAYDTLHEQGLELGQLRNDLARESGREPAQIFELLRKEFSPLVARLKVEIEPATLFLVRPCVEERHS